MDLHGYLRALRRNWWVVLLTTLLGTASAVFVAQQTAPQYESSVTFFVSTSADVAGNAVQLDQYAQRRVNSYVELLNSDNLAQMILDDTGLDMSVAQVSRSIVASAQPETVILTATVTDTSPERSLQIAEAIGRQFGIMIDELENSGSPTSPTVKLNVTSGPALNPVPVAPKTTLIVGLGFLVGLTIGLALAVLREVLDKTIRSADDLRAISDAPVLGTISYDKAAKKSPLIVDSHARSTRAEAFRQLRTNLQFVDATRPVGVLVVTSALAEEGKSTTATNLAVAFADYGHRVLLIEADLRRPRVADYLGVERAVGLTNVLVGQASIDEVLQPWGRGGLTVLPSGTIPPNPSELLGSVAMVELLKGLRRSFDIIILDTPPLLPVTDAAIASRLVDGAVVVVRYGKTTRNQLAAALRSLEAVDARILGTVLTLTPAKVATSYGGYAYYDEREKRKSSKSAKTGPAETDMAEDSPASTPPADPSPAEIVEAAADDGDQASARHRVGLRPPGALGRRSSRIASTMRTE